MSFESFVRIESPSGVRTGEVDTREVTEEQIGASRPPDAYDDKLPGALNGDQRIYWAIYGRALW